MTAGKLPRSTGGRIAISLLSVLVAVFVLLAGVPVVQFHHIVSIPLSETGHVGSVPSTVSGSISLPFSPYALAYDSTNDLLYVVPYSGNLTSVIDPETGGVIASISTGAYPVAVTFDPDNGDLYVANAGSANVSVIDGETNSLVTSIAVSPAPIALAYDSRNGDVYVASLATAHGPSNVTVVNTTTNEVVGTVDIGTPYAGGGGGADGVTFDAADNTIFVSVYFFNGILLNAASGVVAINGTTNVISSTYLANTEGTALDCVQFDPVADEVFACDAGGSSLVYLLDGKTNTLVRMEGVGELPVAATYDPATEGVIIVNKDSNNITEIDGATGLVVGSAPVGKGPTSATYDSINCEVYVANAGSDNLTALFGGRTCHPPTSTVTFSESGLPSGGTWWVNLSDGRSIQGNSSAVEFPAHNGTYSWTVASADKRYIPIEESGQFEVSGQSLQFKIDFSMVYSVSFVESGLPPGTTWGVTLNGSDVTTATWRNGSASGGNTLKIPVPNGTYPWSVDRVPGYQSNVSSGILTIYGRWGQVLINFSAIPKVGGNTWSLIGLDAIQWTEVSFTLVAIAAILIGVLVWRSRGAKKESSAEPLEPPKANPPS